jgi:hypothetical protein
MPKGYPKAKQAVVAPAKPVTGEVEGGDRLLSDYPMADRHNADKLDSRKALVQLGQQYGMLVCQMMDWSMDKLRQQIKYAQTSKLTNDWLDQAESVS